MHAGESATGEIAMDLAEEHRMHISRRFYDCDHDVHKGLGTMYLEDSRFRETYESVAGGLTAFIRDAIHANSARC